MSAAADISVEAALARDVEELGAPMVTVNNAGVTRDNLLFKPSPIGTP